MKIVFEISGKSVFETPHFPELAPAWESLRLTAVNQAKKHGVNPSDVSIRFSENKSKLGKSIRGKYKDAQIPPREEGEG